MYDHKVHYASVYVQINVQMHNDIQDTLKSEKGQTVANYYFVYNIYI